MLRRRVLCPYCRLYLSTTTSVISGITVSIVNSTCSKSSCAQELVGIGRTTQHKYISNYNKRSTCNSMRCRYYFTSSYSNESLQMQMPVTSLHTSRRLLKTLDVREYRPLYSPIEFRFYQRYANHPNRASGVQFLTHYDNHKRFYIMKDFIDYLHWGKEQGQARLPHRHQRVAFDFDDMLHPTKVSDKTMRWFHFHHHDPSMQYPSELSTQFDPEYKPFSHPQHWNKMFSLRRPGEGDIKPEAIDSNNLLAPLLSHSDIEDTRYFDLDPRGPMDGQVPGVNAPFYGEFDHKMMQAMSKPLNRDHTLTANNGRFSKMIYINEPKRHQALSGRLAKELNVEIDKATNAVYAKLTVIEAAQSGLTEYFCAGVDWEQVGFDLVMASKLREEAKQILEEKTKKEEETKEHLERIENEKSVSTGRNQTVKETKKKIKEEEEEKKRKKENTESVNDSKRGNNDTHSSEHTGQDTCSWLALRKEVESIYHDSNMNKNVERQVEVRYRDASRYEDRVDRTIREHVSLIWRAYVAPRPLMALVNGKCKSTGCGLALATKYCALKDSTEFICDGPNLGLTPFNGMMRLLARHETTLKYPGLAEFITLTGTSLFAGDVLKLGWTDLFTSLPDMAFYIKEWFNNSEHMHQDAVAWQLGHLLESCFKMKQHHCSAMERCAITPQRALWIEDAFADQPSVPAIIATLSAMESIPYCDTKHNTLDKVQCTPFTLGSVNEARELLERTQFRYSLSPWDITAPQEPVILKSASSIYLNYVLERHGSSDIAIHADRLKLAKWKVQRENEYHAFKSMKRAPYIRHVFVRVEGCENKLVHFDYTFDTDSACERRKQHITLHKKEEEEEEECYSECNKHNSVSNKNTSKTTHQWSSGHQMNQQNDEDDYKRDSCLFFFKQHILEHLHMPLNREVEIGWYLPTLDTCPLYTDEELIEALHFDPAIEDVSMNLEYPPIYFIVKRCSLYLSEWAYAVKHELLLHSPFALMATFALLQEIRGYPAQHSISCTNNNIDSVPKNSQTITSNTISNNQEIKLQTTINYENDEEEKDKVLLLDACLATEYKYVMRLMKRHDFIHVGQYTNKDGTWWNEVKEERMHNIHKVDAPLRPLPDYETVFERNVTIDNHTFLIRPKWQPRTLEEVSEVEIAQLQLPVNYANDLFCTINPAIYCGKSDRVTGMVEDAGGLEIVPHLGDVDPSTNEPLVAPLESNAFVPQNVNFYEMARHPWNESASSWRQNGFTEGSEQYFEEQYKKAERAVYDEEQRNVYNYWPSANAVKSVSGEDNNALLQERLLGKLSQVEKQVEPWARQLRSDALNNKLKYRTEIATQQEKIYDDEYYRWFIQPGQHPNPSGLVFGRKGSNNVSGSGSTSHGEVSSRHGKEKEDSVELEQFLKTMLENVTVDVQSRNDSEGGNEILSETEMTGSDSVNDIANDFEVSGDEQQEGLMEPFVEE